MIRSFNSLKSKLKSALASSLPGQKAQYQMAPLNRKQSDVLSQNQPKRLSAIMVLIYEHEGEVFSVLIQRPKYKGNHSNQVSFPGGKFDTKHDISLLDTANRETFEEIGIEGIQVIGKLTNLIIPVSSFIVEPYVGFIDFSPAFKPDKFEVQEIISFPLNLLRDESIINEKQFDVSGEIKILAPYFDIQGYSVWGATAMILNEFKTVINEL